MKKIISAIFAVMLMVCSVATFASCGKNNEVIVYTNAFFAPFEYYEGTEIKGVDVDVMAKVGEKLNKKIKFENVEFSAIIDAVEKGKLCDAGAAGITITDERKEKVDFSIPYFTSIQYVIYSKNDASIAVKTGKDNKQYIVWEALEGKKVGTQTDTTGWIYADGEINGEEGVLFGKNSELKNFDSAQIAADGIKSKLVDVVIVDELPAEYITNKNSDLVCLPLYYSGETDAEDEPVVEEYAICVTKGNDELLKAINEVLTSMLVADQNGMNEIDKLVMSHMGLDK